MTCSKLPNYLRTHRKRDGLSQGDIAYLLGGHDSARVSRYEHSHGVPSFHVSVMLIVIFRIPIRDLFAGEYLKVEELVIDRARTLAARLTTQHQDQSVQRRLAALKRIIATLTADENIYDDSQQSEGIRY